MDTHREALSPSPSLHDFILGFLFSSPFVSEGVTPARAAQGLSVPVTNSLAWLSELLGKAVLLKPPFSLITAIVCMRKEGRGTLACSLLFSFSLLKAKEEYSGSKISSSALAACV